ncbi:MAG: hypothetical protein K5696_08505 [Lachnospiraceae bacterium]|nr:hypothetical protein [Lachnospiraceae bacterium]
MTEMEYTEEVIRRADFSAETDLKRRLQATAGRSAAEKKEMAKEASDVREISLDDLMVKSGTAEPETHAKRRVVKNPVELSFGGVKQTAAEAEQPGRNRQ